MMTLRLVTPEEEAEYQASLSEWFTITWATRHRGHCPYVNRRGNVNPIDAVPLALVDDMRPCKRCSATSGSSTRLENER